MKLYFALILAINIHLLSQVTQEWVSRYNGPGNMDDIANSISVDLSGNVYVSGGSFGNSSTLNDFAVIKYNSSGVQLWAARYNGQGNKNEFATSHVVDVSGNIYVTGFIDGNNLRTDIAVVKFNTAGEQLWEVNYNGPANNDDHPVAIINDKFGNLYVTGSSKGINSGSDFVTIKYNSQGAQQWVSRFNGSVNGDDNPFSIAIDSSGNIYVTGQSYNNAPYHYDIVTIKYNSAGLQQWAARYFGLGYDNDWPEEIAVDISGNVYIVGQSISSGTANDFVTLKYNTNGIQQWAARYNGTANSIDEGTSLAVDRSGNIYVTGFSLSIGSEYDFVTIKYNNFGDSLWVRKYDGSSNHSDVANSITLDNTGNVYVTGRTRGSGGFNDFATVKYSPNGDYMWSQKYNGPANDEDNPVAIVADNSGNIFVTGQSNGIGSGRDFATVKYSQPIGINELSTEIPGNFSLSQNYPNPFNPSTKIEFNIPLLRGVSAESGGGVFTSLKIYDILGKELQTLVNQNLKPGTYQAEWNASAFPGGLYFYKLTAGNFSETKKMILIK